MKCFKLCGVDSLSSGKFINFSRVSIVLALVFIVVVGVAAKANATPLTLPNPATMEAGALYTWGLGLHGRTGHGDTVDRNAPERLGEASNWVQVAAGNGHVLALNSSGEIWTWGLNSAGQLGHGEGFGGYETTPRRMGTASNWVQVAAQGINSAALNANGEIFAWGSNNEANLAQGNVGGAFDLDAPARIGTENNWVQIDIAEFGGLALNSSGEIFTWGCNSQGASGQGYPLASTNHITTPRRLGTASNWTYARMHTRQGLAINSAGELWTWGHGANGRLGLGDTTSRNVPTRVGTASNWVHAAAFNGHTMAINSAGELWTWGANTAGQLGLDDTAQRNTPARVGTASNWQNVSLGTIGGVGHSFAVNRLNHLYSWGNNASGQLGLGDFTNRYTPTRLIMPGVEHMQWYSLATGQAFSAAIGNELPPTPLIKTLQAAQGISFPAEIDFDFNFVPTVISLNDTALGEVGAIPSRNPSNYPALNIATQTIEFRAPHSPTNIAGSIQTLTSTIDIANEVFAPLEFPGGGIFVWNVYEVPNSSGLNNPPNVTMTYDTARFQVRVHITSLGAIEMVEVLPMQYYEGVWSYVLPKRDSLDFVNTYRVVIEQGLQVTKTVTGQFANLSQPFYFELTLAASTLHPIPETITVPVVSNTAPHDPVSPARTVTITNGQANFYLLHGQRLAIPNLPGGTTFTITELANPEYAPQVNVVVGGNIVANLSADRGYLLSTGDPRFIAQTNRNATDFTNDHRFIPPTGLVIANIPYALLVAASLLLVLLLAKRNRKRIETIPLVHQRATICEKSTLREIMWSNCEIVPFLRQMRYNVD